MRNISVHKTANFLTNIIKLQFNYKCVFCFKFNYYISITYLNNHIDFYLLRFMDPGNCEHKWLKKTNETFD
jgi:hypothetical protein